MKKLGDFSSTGFFIYEDPSTFAIYRLHYSSGEKLYSAFETFINNISKGEFSIPDMSGFSDPTIVVNPASYAMLQGIGLDEED